MRSHSAPDVVARWGNPGGEMAVGDPRGGRWRWETQATLEASPEASPSPNWRLCSTAAAAASNVPRRVLMIAAWLIVAVYE
jgi:hypothetical protein